MHKGKQRHFVFSSTRRKTIVNTEYTFSYTAPSVQLVDANNALLLARQGFLYDLYEDNGDVFSVKEQINSVHSKVLKSMAALGDLAPFGIRAITINPEQYSGQRCTENIEYSSAIITPRTLRAALKSVDIPDLRYAGLISFNGWRYTDSEIHAAVGGCHTEAQARRFLDILADMESRGTEGTLGLGFGGSKAMLA